MADYYAEHQSTWDDPAVKRWKDTARRTHKCFYAAFQGRQWDEYGSDERELLRVKICYAIFGAPENNNTKLEDIEKVYSREQCRIGNEIKDTILQVSKGKLAVGIIFVCCKQEDKEFSMPIFRVRTGKTSCSYIDTNLRVYESWSNWKESNPLPMLKYCYPKDGFYSCKTGCYQYDANRDPVLEFGTSPACNVSSRVFRQLDILGTGTSLITAAIGIGSMFTPIGPAVLAASAVAGGASALWGAGRSVERLVDKGSHGESLIDREAILCGLTILATHLHVATASANAALSAGARTGRVFTSTIRSGVTILNCTTIVLDSSMLVMGFANLYDKYEHGQLNTLDILQFSLSAFFFTHTLIQPKTASGIIRAAQNHHFDTYRKNLSDAEAKAGFKKFVTENNKNMGEGAKIVKTINRIRDPDSFFKTAHQKDANIKVQGRSGKTVLVNDQVRINPNRFNQLPRETGEELMRITKQFSETKITPEQYKKSIAGIRTRERLQFEIHRNETINKLTEYFGAQECGLENVKINGKKIFQDIKGRDIDRIGTVFGDTARNYNRDIIDTGLHVIAKKLNCDNIHDICAAVELVAAECRGKTKPAMAAFLNELQRNPQFNEEFVTGIKKDCVAVNNIFKNSKYKFKSTVQAVYHYRKHGKEFGTNVTMNVYLDSTPKELFQNKYLFKDVYDQDGRVRMRTYANPDSFAFGVVTTCEQGESSIATVFKNNAKFFDDWTQKFDVAQQHLNFTTPQYNKPLPPVASFYDCILASIVRNMGFAATLGYIVKNGKRYKAEAFTNNNSSDVRKMKELADNLALLSKYLH